MKKRYFDPFMPNLSRARFFPILLLLSVLSLGCQGSVGAIRGSLPESSRIALAEGNWTSGTWQGTDCSVSYKYLRTGNNLDLTGQVSLASKVTENFPFIDFFHLQAYLLDSAGNVVGSKGVMSGGSTSTFSPNYNMPFQATIALPPGTSSIAFTYTGRASQPSTPGGAPVIYDFNGGP